MSEPAGPGEFDLIARYFAPLAAGEPGALGLLDDAAVLAVDAGSELVLTADALVAGVHFRHRDAPGQVAQKALRVNLSDLAAKGARPRGYLMTLALAPANDEAWIAAFTDGLAQDQQRFSIALLGGDTVATPGPATISITALGIAPKGGALRRSAACAGDDVYVSGTIGDGYLGLHTDSTAFAKLDVADRRALGQRYLVPEPRIGLGLALGQSGVAHAAADVSDGLVADLGHICTASRLDATIDAGRVPLSAAAGRALAAGLAGLEQVLCGGDDYEIIFTAPPAARPEIDRLAGADGVAISRIGRMEACLGDAPAVRVTGPDGRLMRIAKSGFAHF